MKTFKNVDLVILEDDNGNVTFSVCHGDEFYDVTFPKENCECVYEKGIGEKYSSSEFDSFDKFYDFMKRNFQNKMCYCECMEKYFPKTKVENSLTLENEMDDFLSNLSEEKKEKFKNDLTKIVTEIAKKTKLYL